MMSYTDMVTWTKDPSSCLFFCKKTRKLPGKNMVHNVFPQKVSNKIKEPRFYYDKYWGYILLLPLLNTSLPAK